jgi:hypothetical protein
MAARNRQTSASADGLSPTRSGGQMVWPDTSPRGPAADGRYTVGDDSQQELADAVESVRGGGPGPAGFPC